MKEISFYLEENDSADPEIKDPQIFLGSATTPTSIFWPQSKSELSCPRAKRGGRGIENGHLCKQHSTRAKVAPVRGAAAP